MLPQLVNELSEHGDVALILDDFDRCLERSRARHVAWLIEHAPSTFHLVLASRNEPALPLGALRARGELLEVRADDLRFTADEAEALLNERLELGLARADVEPLVERTEGWPAGIYLAALSLRGVEDRGASPASSVARTATSSTSSWTRSSRRTARRSRHSCFAPRSWSA